MYYKYFTCGSMSEKEGLTTAKFSYYDDGSLAVGVPNPKKLLYKLREITQEEYDNIERQMKDVSVKKGFAGIVNEEGWEKYKSWAESELNKISEKNESKISLVVRKIKKQLELGIITVDDIDVEIELNNMKEFKNEIKARLQ